MVDYAESLRHSNDGAETERIIEKIGIALLIKEGVARLTTPPDEEVLAQVRHAERSNDPALRRDRSDWYTNSAKSSGKTAMSAYL